jgi:hypothetical protein
MIDPHSFPMTQLLTGVGQMAFQSIGFAAAQILNRLRNEQQITDDKSADDARRQKQDREEQEARAEFKRVNSRLVALNKKLGR